MARFEYKKSFKRVRYIDGNYTLGVERLENGNIEIFTHLQGSGPAAFVVMTPKRYKELLSYMREIDNLEPERRPKRRRTKED